MADWALCGVKFRAAVWVQYSVCHVGLKWLSPTNGNSFTGNEMWRRMQIAIGRDSRNSTS